MEAKRMKTKKTIIRRFTNAMVKYWPYYLMMLLPAVIIIIYRIVPLFGLQIAFKEYYPRVGIMKSEWVGFAHFKKFFGGSDFLRVFANTLKINFLKLLFGFPAPIILALAFNAITGKKFQHSMQIISYIPQFLSWVIVYGFMYMLFNYNFGAINLALNALGFERVPFLASEKWLVPMLIFSYVWKSAGWGSITYFAALGNINPEYYEAADIDGASGWNKLWYITLPMLLPTMTLMLLIQVGTLLYGDFEQNLIFMGNNSLLRKQGEILETYMFNLGIGGMQYSFATAVGLFQSFFGAALVCVSNFLTKRMNGYSIW